MESTTLFLKRENNVTAIGSELPQAERCAACHVVADAEFNCSVNMNYLTGVNCFKQPCYFVFNHRINGEWKECTADNTETGDTVRNASHRDAKRTVSYIFKNGLRMVLSDSKGGEYTDYTKNYQVLVKD